MEHQPSEVMKPYNQRLARHFEQAKLYSDAERYYIAAEEPKKAVEMFIRTGRSERRQIN